MDFGHFPNRTYMEVGIMAWFEIFIIHQVKKNIVEGATPLEVSTQRVGACA